MNRNQKPYLTTATFPGAKTPPAKRDRRAWEGEYSKKRDTA